MPGCGTRSHALTVAAYVHQKEQRPVSHRPPRNSCLRDTQRAYPSVHVSGVHLLHVFTTFDHRSPPWHQTHPRSAVAARARPLNSDPSSVLKDHTPAVGAKRKRGAAFATGPVAGNRRSPRHMKSIGRVRGRSAVFLAGKFFKIRSATRQCGNRRWSGTWRQSAARQRVPCGCCLDR